MHLKSLDISSRFRAILGTTNGTSACIKQFWLTLKYLEGLVELELAAEACVSNADGKLWKCGYLRLPAFRQYLFGAVSICTPLHHCKPTRLQKKNFYARTTFKGSKSHLTFKKSWGIHTAVLICGVDEASTCRISKSLQKSRRQRTAAGQRIVPTSSVSVSAAFYVFSRFQIV